MDKELAVLAEEIVKTIERENAFEDGRKSGGFVESLKAKEAKKVFL